MNKCHICCKEFSQKSDLTRHIRIHTGERPYKCNVCEKAFTQSGDLTIHKRIHTGEKPYSCNICNKAFSKQSHLTYHKRMHTGENKPYSCELCKTYVCSNSELLRHNNSVTHLMMLESTKITAPHSASTSFIDYNEANINIEIKEEQTLDKDPLFSKMEAESIEETMKKKKYEESQDEDSPIIQLRIPTGEKPFKCDTCKKLFSHKSYLNIHKKVFKCVKTYSCDACEKTFTDISALTEHRRIHTFSCYTCKKNFSRQSYLTDHKRIHTGEKPYLCVLCRTSYYSSSYLSRHYKSAEHLKKLESTKNKVQTSASTSFVNCGEANIKLEIKEEETPDEDPLFIKLEAESV